MASSSRPYDLLIYGATGFTGRLVAIYLAKHAPPSLRWGIAGRDSQKLQNILTEVVNIQQTVTNVPNQPVGVVVGHGLTVINVAKATKAVITTVGPFMLYGEPLVKACVEVGTDYADITGESLWVHQMIQKYSAEAKKKGVCIVSMCGFDSIPADLGTFFMLDHIRRTYNNVRVSEVTSYMYGKGNVSGGTIASALNLATHPDRRQSFNPYFLVPSGAPNGGPSPSALVAPLRDGGSPSYNTLFKQYNMLFVMAAINNRIVRRSAAIFALEGNQFGTNPNTLSPITSSPSSSSSAVASRSYSIAPFRYSEYMLTRSWFTAWSTTLGLGAFMFLSSIPGFISIIRRYLPKPGEGPSDKTMKNSWFHYYLVAKTEEENSRTVIGRVRGGDGGYEETSKMLAEVGLCFALQRNELPGVTLGGGFLTPATCFGRVLVQRLQNANLLFEIVPNNTLLEAMKDRRPVEKNENTTVVNTTTTTSSGSTSKAGTGGGCTELRSRL